MRFNRGSFLFKILLNECTRKSKSPREKTMICVFANESEVARKRQAERQREMNVKRRKDQPKKSMFCSFTAKIVYFQIIKRRAHTHKITTHTHACVSLSR